MNDREFVSAILSGVILGMVFTLLLYVIVGPVRVDTASEMDGPDKSYEIIIDDLMFHCLQRPIQSGARLRLNWCKEGYGRTIIIRDYETYTVTEINN